MTRNQMIDAHDYLCSLSGLLGPLGELAILRAIAALEMVLFWGPQ